MKLTEYLSPDILGRNIVRSFLPIHVTQWILGSNRVNIRANFAMPITRVQKIYSLILAALVGYTCVLLVIAIHKLYHKENRSAFLLGCTGILSDYLMFLSFLFHIRFAAQNDSIRMYVLLQKVDRMLNVTQSKKAFRKNFIANWIILAISLFHFPISILHLYPDMGSGGNIMLFFMGLSHVVANMEVMFIGSLLYYVAVRLKFFNNALKKHTAVKVEKIVTTNAWFENSISVNNSGRSPIDETKRLFVTLEHILAAFRVINKVYSFQMLTLGMSAFYWPQLIVVSFALGLGSKLAVSWVASLALVLWGVLNYLQLVFLAFVSDRVGKRVNDTKRLCIDVLSKCYEGPLVKSVKDMLTIIEWEEPKFSVYGIFTLDRNLPLRMFGLITAYIIILVQFTFL